MVALHSGGRRREGGKKGGRENRWSTGDFKDSETILYDTVKVGTYHYIVVKTHRNVQHRVYPNVYSGH